MDKAKQFIERHVQWLVLAIALCYVGYTVWTYVVNPPLFVSLKKNGPIVLPGDIDDTIKKNQIDPLRNEIAIKTVSAPKVTDVLTEFDDRLNERRTEVTVMKNPWDAPYRPVNTGPANLGPDVIVKVNQLPVLPPALFDSASVRRTVIMAPGRKDVAYASVRFTIDLNALAQNVAKAFNNPGIPPNIFNNEFVSVELLREELLSSGAWSAPVSIQPLYLLEKCPGDVAKLPKDLLEFGKFQLWMDKNQPTISQPSFLKTAADVEPWMPPGGAAPAGAVGAPPAPAPGVPAAVAPAANPNAAQPNGGFNALAQIGNISIIAHDITIEEGKSYRYAVRYKFYNPLFNKQVFAQAPIDSTFAISSPDPIQINNPKAWSGPISAEPSSYVFVTKINPVTGHVWFDVFEWKNGHWHWTKAEQNKQGLIPGDPIAGGQGVSKFMLVDVRKELRELRNVPDPFYSIVMDAAGDLQARNTRDDAADPIYNRLKAQAVGAGAAVGPAPATPPKG